MDRWLAAITSAARRSRGKTCSMMQNLMAWSSISVNRIVSEDRRLSGKVRPSGVFLDFVWCVAFLDLLCFLIVR